MQDFNESTVLNIDVGNYFAAPGPGSRAVNDLMLEAAADLPMDVMNVTAKDLEAWDRLGPPGSRTRLVSTNLELDGKLSFEVPRYVVAELSAGATRLRIGFLGVVSSSHIAPRLGVQSENPVAAARRFAPEAIREADFLVILADVDDETAAALARVHPRVYAVVQLKRRYQLPRPLQIDNAVLLRTVERGRYLMRLDLEVLDGEVVSYAPDYVRLDSDVRESRKYLRRSGEIVGHLP